MSDSRIGACAVIVAAMMFTLFRMHPVSGQSPSNQEINDRYAEEVMAKIAGHERDSASQVFKNVDRLKDVPASTLVSIMNAGYSKALGVTCTHCHVVDDFASDAKREKRAAREMQTLHRGINDQLSKMDNLTIPNDRRSINCATCHRGQINPLGGS